MNEYAAKNSIAGYILTETLACACLLLVDCRWGGEGGISNLHTSFFLVCVRPLSLQLYITCPKINNAGTPHTNVSVKILPTMDLFAKKVQMSRQPILQPCFERMRKRTRVPTQQTAPEESLQRHQRHLRTNPGLEKTSSLIKGERLKEDCRTVPPKLTIRPLPLCIVILFSALHHAELLISSVFFIFPSFFSPSFF